MVVFAAFVIFAPEKPSSSARLVSARSESITGQAGGEGSDEYNDKLKKHDAQQADAALQKGKSFVPTPVGQRKPVVVKKEDTRPAPPPVTQVRTAPVRTQATDNAMLKRMMDDLNTLDTKLSAVSAGEGKIVYLREFSEEAPVATPVAAVQETAQPANAPKSGTLKPGDLLYAIMDVGVNSDVPSAVLVGTALDPSRSKQPQLLPGITINTLWGEIAAQLALSANKPKLYEIIKEADKKGISPGSEALKTLFNACGPCLILMDELVADAFMA